MKQLIVLIVISMQLAGCASHTKTTDLVEHESVLSNNNLYFGGDIVTMQGDTANYVESVVSADGKIVFVGSKREAEKLHPNSKRVDLKGKTLLPGFIDSHGHLSGVGLQAAAANLLPAPDGEGNSVDDLKRILRQWIDNNHAFIEKTGWIIGFGYDDAQLDYYPTKADLDEVSTEYPIIILHQSSHLSVLNSKGLEVAGITASTQDPEGGVIRRVEGGMEPNGVLEETIHYQVLFFNVMRDFDLELDLENLRKGQNIYASYGYTTAQDGRSIPSNTASFAQAAEQKLFFLDVVSYPDIESNAQAAESSYHRKSYQNHYRIGGVKLSLDGSPQGKTAWLSQPYLIPPAGQNKEYQGYASMSDEKAQAYFASAYANNWQILAHANGDAAIDQLIKSVELAQQKFGGDDRRSVAIHAQTSREDQLDEFKRLEILPSFFPMHTFYWGDWHVNSVLGKQRAYKISPTATALEKGLRFTSHHDAPVALPDSIRVLAATVTRKSRTGDIIGPDERVSAYVALKSLTEWAAYQYFEEDLKGTIEVGKLADFVMLDMNPLKINSSEIENIKVMETIKEGKTVYIKQP